mmetsp:Transcript_105928/g.338262  ORF Transcript_105928/g.338262 Transcript_105928/m.338262 type:complete len:363 (-) Transcript_105928:502-1590(-)
MAFQHLAVKPCRAHMRDQVVEESRPVHKVGQHLTLARRPRLERMGLSHMARITRSRGSCLGATLRAAHLCGTAFMNLGLLGLGAARSQHFHTGGPGATKAALTAHRPAHPHRPAGDGHAAHLLGLWHRAVASGMGHGIETTTPLVAKAGAEKTDGRLALSKRLTHRMPMQQALGAVADVTRQVVQRQENSQIHPWSRQRQQTIRTRGGRLRSRLTQNETLKILGSHRGKTLGPLVLPLRSRPTTLHSEGGRGGLRRSRARPCQSPSTWRPECRGSWRGRRSDRIETAAALRIICERTFWRRCGTCTTRTAAQVSCLTIVQSPGPFRRRRFQCWTFGSRTIASRKTSRTEIMQARKSTRSLGT